MNRHNIKVIGYAVQTLLIHVNYYDIVLIHRQDPGHIVTDLTCANDYYAHLEMCDAVRVF